VLVVRNGKRIRWHGEGNNLFGHACFTLKQIAIDLMQAA